MLLVILSGLSIEYFLIEALYNLSNVISAKAEIQEIAGFPPQQGMTTIDSRAKVFAGVSEGVETLCTSGPSCKSFSR